MPIWCVEGGTELTTEEAKQVMIGFRELLKPYERAHRPDPPEGAQRVSFILRVIPTEI